MSAMAAKDRYGAGCYAAKSWVLPNRGLSLTIFFSDTGRFFILTQFTLAATSGGENATGFRGLLGSNSDNQIL
jgi:hypothetical protein